MKLLNEHKNTSDIVQIDLLKGLAIICVILGHIVSYQALVTDPQIMSNSSTINQINFDFINLINLQNFYKIFSHWITFSALFMQQTVLLFLMIMSFNLSLASYRRGYSKLNQFYSPNEIKKKFRRYFIPYIIIFFISLILGWVYLLVTNYQILVLNFRLLMGYLPINGPGNYFIALMIQIVVIFPLVHVCYKYNRTLSTISVFLLAFIWEISNNFGTSGYWYIDCIVRFLPHIILGIWISDLYLVSDLKNKYFLFFGIFSGLYLILISQFENGILGGIHFIPYTASQNLFGSGWTALILIIGLMYLKNIKKIIAYPIALIGKSTYHIYLIQIVFFGLLGGFGLKYHSLSDLLSLNNILIIGMTVSIVILIGVGFYILDKHDFYLKKGT